MNKVTILICDDNPVVTLGLAGYLEAEGMTVISAESGEDALEKIKSGMGIDLVILDIMLPGISGVEVCREIRIKSDIPVLMLSAKGEEIDRIIGLEMGADDYVTKPFSSREVVIRVKKLLARTGRKSVPVHEIKVGNLRIFPESFEAFSGSELISLSPREFKLLCYLAENAGRIRSRDQIISEIWGTEFEGESRVLDILVNRLRSRLKKSDAPDTKISINTVFGIGYTLVETDEK